jgi:hypothetical protein
MIDFDNITDACPHGIIGPCEDCDALGAASGVRLRRLTLYDAKGRTSFQAVIPNDGPLELVLDHPIPKTSRIRVDFVYERKDKA